MKRAHFVLFVSDQERSRAFYEQTLRSIPQLHVPGMTEFALPGGAVLGLMPESGIERLLDDERVRPSHGSGVPRAELYLVVEDARAFLERAIHSGAEPLSPVKLRDWGHAAGYCLDPDGHVLAFAEILGSGRSTAGPDRCAPS